MREICFSPMSLSSWRVVILWKDRVCEGTGYQLVYFPGIWLVEELLVEEMVEELVEDSRIFLQIFDQMWMSKDLQEYSRIFDQSSEFLLIG